MVAQTKKQPFKASADYLIRYKGLNNTLWPLAQKPFFYFIDVSICDSDSMVGLILEIKKNNNIGIRLIFTAC